LDGDGVGDGVGDGAGVGVGAGVGAISYFLLGSKLVNVAKTLFIIAVSLFVAVALFICE
jgi:hypothetical protein